MFTGLIEEIGVVTHISEKPGYRLMAIEAERVLDETRVGDSICVDGACQTVTGIEGKRFTVEALAVTLEKTTLGRFGPGKRVNLERAVTPKTRLGGHFVQGHVDATAQITALVRSVENAFLTIRIPEELLDYCVREGSVAIDGVSLTIADLKGPLATLNIIPQTWRNTVLSDRRQGESVNIEVDIIGRYVARMLGIGKGGADRRLSVETLTAWGYEQ